LLKKWNWRINNESTRTKLRFNQSSKSINRGQEAYLEIASQFGNTGTSKANQSWGSHADAVESKLQEVRANTEKFLKIHTPKKTIRQIGEDVDALAQSSNKVIRIGDYSKEAN